MDIRLPGGSGSSLQGGSNFKQQPVDNSNILVAGLSSVTVSQPTGSPPKKMKTGTEPSCAKAIHDRALTSHQEFFYSKNE